MGRVNNSKSDIRGLKIHNTVKWEDLERVQRLVK